jgi:cytochrome oxidase Cu insertion factor (SCO1/SenC/PrrC family)
MIPTPNSASQYTVAHSTTVYALDVGGKTRMEFPYDATVDQIASGLKQILASGPHS